MQNGKLNNSQRSALVKLVQNAYERRIAVQKASLHDELTRITQDVKEELGITDVVRFVGLVHHSRVIEYLQSASMLVLPSLSEGCPLVVLEAFAAGTPVVASRVGGIPEVVAEGESGSLVSPADPAALAEAIVELLTDPQKRERFARAGRARVERELSWDSVATETCQVYADVSGDDGHI